MDNNYKLHLVKELPPLESEPRPRPPIGGFGIAEDDLIYQMLLKNLEKEDRPNIHRQRNERAND